MLKVVARWRLDVRLSKGSLRDLKSKNFFRNLNNVPFAKRDICDQAVTNFSHVHDGRLPHSFSTQAQDANFAFITMPRKTSRH